MADSTLDEVREGLESLAHLRRAAEVERAEAMAGIADWLRVGQEHGVPIAHMADWAGLTRQTVYTLLSDDDRP